MPLNAFKYCSPFIMYALAYIAFTNTGWLAFVGVAYAFGLIPFLELLLPANEQNLSATEEAIAKQNHWYDYILYAIVLCQIPMVFFFLQSIQQPNLQTSDIVGRVATMGILCGTFGINVGHELGHRNNKFEQRLAQLNLLTSLYMHFFIEHNKGHHKHVATPNDPSSAPYKQSLYRFWLRSVVGTYTKAWKIANQEIQQQQLPWWHFKNEMLQFQIVQIIWLGIIFYIAGVHALLYYIVAATIGFLLLETVNYIEHYGLLRKQTTEGKYERTMPQHSWNSNHVIGRLMLFELSRHSDHHYLASRKYQVLRHHEAAPQMPTGYPGMMLLSTIPPIFFAVMDKQMKKYNLL
jgi:alkane 1-monooxygenase